MPWHERLADWGWGIVLLIMGGVGTIMTRWVSMIHKHEQHIALLQQEMASRQSANGDVLRMVADVGHRLDLHRQESVERMDALRRDMKEDIKTLIELATKTKP